MKSLPLKENLKKYSGIKSCPIRNVVSRFSGKWSMLVLCVLAENEAHNTSAATAQHPTLRQREYWSAALQPLE